MTLRSKLYHFSSSNSYASLAVLEFHQSANCSLSSLCGQDAPGISFMRGKKDLCTEVPA